MEFLVFGAGAIGSVIGGFLHKAGHSVWLHGRREHMEAIRQDGLFVDGIWGKHHIQGMKVSWDVKDLEGQLFEHVLLTVKSFDTEEAVRQMRPCLKENSLVVSLQNGLGNWETIAEGCGWERTIGGRVIFGAERPRPGAVTVTVYAEEVMLGALSNKADPKLVEKLAKIFSQAGIPALPTEEITSYLWAKVLYNASLNPLSVLLGASYGELAENPETRLLLEQVIREIFEVAHAEEVPLFWNEAEGYLEKFFGREVPATAKHRSSMLQAIEEGRRLDIDALNGFIVRLAEKHGIPVPVNRTLLALVKAKSEGKFGNMEPNPSVDSFRV